MGNISQQGAVDFLAGAGHMRYATKGIQEKVLSELREQLRGEGLCTTCVIPQPGPWEAGKQTLVMDLLRSLGQVGAMMIIGAQGGCPGAGPVIARSSYRQRAQAKSDGVTVKTRKKKLGKSPKNLK